MGTRPALGKQRNWVSRTQAGGTPSGAATRGRRVVLTKPRVPFQQPQFHCAVHPRETDPRSHAHATPRGNSRSAGNGRGEHLLPTGPRQAQARGSPRRENRRPTDPVPRTSLREPHGQTPIAEARGLHGPTQIQALKREDAGHGGLPVGQGRQGAPPRQGAARGIWGTGRSLPYPDRGEHTNPHVREHRRARTLCTEGHVQDPGHPSRAVRPCPQPPPGWASTGRNGDRRWALLDFLI